MNLWRNNWRNQYLNLRLNSSVKIYWKSKGMPNLYIIAGCNGAGKTTASYTILPEMLNCKELVNADSIAAGLSPFKPESVAFEAGRIMLNRIHQLINEKADFGFETTLAAKSYISLIRIARKSGYEITFSIFG